MLDICLPDDNEQEIIEQAGQLGHQELIFLYSFRTREELRRKRLEVRELAKNIPVKIGVCVKLRNFSDFKRIRNVVQEADFVAVSSQDTNTLRGVLKQGTDCIFEVELDTVLASILRETNTAYAISFSNILNKEGIRRARQLRLEMQNISLCRHSPVMLFSFARNKWELRKPEDLASFGRLLGIKPI